MRRELPADKLLPESFAVAARAETPVSRLEPERRSERQFVRVPLPFELDIEGSTVNGVDLSLDGLAVAEPVAVDQADEPIDCRLRLLFKGCELTFQLQVKPVDLGLRGRVNKFQITWMEEAQREVLRKTIRAFLAGQLMTFEGLLLPADAQTERQRREHQEALERQENSNEPKSVWQRYARYGMLGAGATLLFVFLFASIFQRVAVVESHFAALTAPRIEIRAPASGRLAAHGLSSGMLVERDRHLTSIIDADLSSELEIARAEQSLLEGRLALASSGQQPSTVGLASPRGGVRLALPESVANASIPGQVGQAAGHLTEEVELGRIRVAALEQRSAANELHSPCGCEIVWAVSDGEWVEKGERVFSLIRADSNALSVEALVHMSDIQEIRPHDEVYIELPHTGELIAGRVLAIRLDPDRGPRAGFPPWVAQDQSLASVEIVPSQAIPTSQLGVPLRVLFTSWPNLAAFLG